MINLPFSLIPITRGYEPLDFSLTHANGTRCEHCTGDGIITTNLQFMADIERYCSYIQ